MIIVITTFLQLTKLHVFANIALVLSATFLIVSLHFTEEEIHLQRG